MILIDSLPEQEIDFGIYLLPNTNAISFSP